MMPKPNNTKDHDQIAQGTGNPLSGPIARADEHRRILQEAAGEMLSAKQVSDLTGLNVQTIDEMRMAGELLAVKIDATSVYPAFQFNQGAVDPLMMSVLSAHKEDSPWVVLDILLAKDDAFMGKSMLQLVQDRDHRAVTRYLAQLDTDGFS
ncbi:hypothetical protein JQX09_23520 [Sulfitobacter pseudonitzschiae]|nr:hypothetical protein [Pseudosulfitobacter pseudonitzschiae]MBM2294902.1 hypothetical protein [Pseudosulfitobacter pseudonitzschiae]MBM2299818.1 hypothetical protein [Pseudosulfitobacter pseudonitzschiae]MBM2304739.1 hypothetical protein [Pseudosulfitobacter pseudonitzschiae]MBM2314513.1 hypothetical protein [Pseudosulfitobacter pseudonitzschiae]MBM2319423.1 hypothetical protein [Pseudosulfitobacter pseudonitzschiae]